MKGITRNMVKGEPRMIAINQIYRATVQIEAVSLKGQA